MAHGHGAKLIQQARGSERARTRIQQTRMPTLISMDSTSI